MSRWSKHEDDDRPLTIEEFQEMKLEYERQVRDYIARWNRGDRAFFYKHQRRTVSRRELKYLEMLEQSVDDIF